MNISAQQDILKRALAEHNVCDKVSKAEIAQLTDWNIMERLLRDNGRYIYHMNPDLIDEDMEIIACAHEDRKNGINFLMYLEREIKLVHIAVAIFNWGEVELLDIDEYPEDEYRQAYEWCPEIVVFATNATYDEIVRAAIAPRYCHDIVYYRANMGSKVILEHCSEREVDDPEGHLRMVYLTNEPNHIDMVYLDDIVDIPLLPKETIKKIYIENMKKYIDCYLTSGKNVDEFISLFKETHPKQLNEIDAILRTYKKTKTARNY